MQNLGNISGINAFQPVDNSEDRLSGAAGVDAAGLDKSGPEAEQKEANKGWILNPILDYLFVCGGLMWMLYGATLLGVDAVGSNANSRLYGSILYWGALILADSHGPATMVRVFGSKTTPNRVRYIVVFWAVILVGVSCFSLGNRPLAQAFVTITRLWAVQHYIAQTFGIVLIYCLKRDYKLDPFERFVFQGLMRSMMWFIFIRFFTFPEYGHVENFMGLDLPFYGPLPSIYVFSSQFVFTFFVLLFTVSVILHLIFKKQFFPLPALIAIFSVAAVTLSPRNGFYLLGVTFLHSSQYIAITLAYFLREKSFVRTGHVPRNILPKLVSWWTVGWFGVIVTLGYIGSIALPEFGIKVGLPDALVLCTVYALLSCHHFLTDAFIWRIRDPQVRKLLV